MCNTYPKWHLALCDDGGMSVEECGCECVHVTPLDVAALRSEPNQQKDLEAASIASHHQVSCKEQIGLFFFFANFYSKHPETASIAFTPPGKFLQKSMSCYICAVNSLHTDFSESLPPGLSKVST